MNRPPRGKVLFITGTDTGVGKTVLTVLLLRFLRSQGVHAIALKPFCSGPRDDATWLHEEGGGELTLDEINPYHFQAPVAPAATRSQGKKPLTRSRVLAHIHRVATHFDVTLVEGIGGLLVPLTRSLVLADVIEGLKCETAVVGKDALGTLNHSLLTFSELRRRKIPATQLVLMKNFAPDASQSTNSLVLSQLIAPVPVAVLPKLVGGRLLKPKNKLDAIILKKTIARFGEVSIFCPRRCEHDDASRKQTQRRGRAGCQ